jgi:hypothetical protein
MELYSKRRKAAENPPTAYRYDLPLEFRNQVIYIWKASIGFLDYDPRQFDSLMFSPDRERVYQICSAYENLNQFLCEELGLSGLAGDGPCRQLTDWFLRAETDIALDIIEVSFRMIPLAQRDYKFMSWVKPQLTASDALARLNQRFQENAIGYRLANGQMVRLDSEFLHADTTEPAFRLLHKLGFEGALEEFELAHRRFREGPAHYDDCLTNCLKALESTLKTICGRRNWAYNPNDTASKLIDVVFKNGLIPSYLQTHFSALRSSLASGVPTIRNREGGHGSGEKPNDVPEYLAAYQLHLTASAIVFLIRANEQFGKTQPL